MPEGATGVLERSVPPPAEGERKRNVPPLASRLAFQTVGLALSPEGQTVSDEKRAELKNKTQDHLVYDAVSALSLDSRKEHYKDSDKTLAQNTTIWNEQLQAWATDENASDDKKAVMDALGLASAADRGKKEYNFHRQVKIKEDEEEKIETVTEKVKLFSAVEDFRRSYLGGSSNVERFVKAIAETCRPGNGQPVAMELLMRRLDAVEDLLVIFGKDPSIKLLVKSYAFTYGMLTQQGESKDALIAEAAQAMTGSLIADEKTALDLLAKKQDALTRPATPASPPDGVRQTDEETSPDDAEPAEVDNPTTEAERIALALLDYQTGEVKQDANIDLQPSFSRLVEAVKAKIDSNPEYFFDGSGKPVYVLSDVARAILDQIAREGNKRNAEFAVGLQGVHIKDDLFVIAFVSPASDFNNQDPAHAYAEDKINEKNARSLVQQTHLAELLKQHTGDYEGAELGRMPAYLHVHPIQRGENNAGEPSVQDIEQGQKYFTQARLLNGRPRDIGVITRTDDGLKINIVSFKQTDTGVIEPRPHSKVVREEELLQTQPTPPATAQT
jgi:hypothetical protein